ncbi:hypothetical protein O181_000764 [Austropuccinia psidii MF-1]|uniref:Non-ribosomal peptide synthetase n=1 Tax=Austropuccinia psidii MF-1 TaxID=1389203 RepID=A0A9Q3GB80_9BASI|nr:hypothetical protein [Austropuccinia psidii MF-1]
MSPQRHRRSTSSCSNNSSLSVETLGILPASGPKEEEDKKLYSSSNHNDVDPIFKEVDSTEIYISEEEKFLPVSLGHHRSNTFSTIGTVFEFESTTTNHETVDAQITAETIEKNKFEENLNSTPKITRLISFKTWFTPYRKLFLLLISLNAIGAGFELSNHWPWATRNLTALVIGNTLAAMSVRSEWVLRFLYWTSVKIFRPFLFPVWLRAKVVGILYHIGGIHSGCGTSALVWLVIACYRHFLDAAQYHPSVLVALSICLSCVFATCVTALPVFRGPFHNAFELIHRFVGWIGIISTLAFVLLSSFWNYERQEWNTSISRVLSKVELWFMVAIIIIVIASWITIAKVPVTIYTASEKASVIRVPGGLTSGLHTRISKGGLREWHIFGSISVGRKAKYHYVVAAVQGEFTKMLNVEKPTILYTKRWKPCGLPYFSRLFKRGVAICTGSGIGAVGSTCIQHEDWFLIWIGPDIEKTYGPEIMNLITEWIPPERRLIWDTRGKLGRPDVVRLLRDTVQSWNAEVALFIGSPALNKTVLKSARALKIPVFGSIWDA